MSFGNGDSIRKHLERCLTVEPGGDEVACCRMFWAASLHVLWAVPGRLDCIDIVQPSLRCYAPMLLKLVVLPRLSLQYHPDKNKSKGAQEKFAEINNAYDILSDEDKRKNFDLYGDEKGNPGFNAGNTGDQGGYTYFTNGGPGHSGFTFRPDEWQNMGGQGSPGSFSFSFGGSGGQRSFGFGLDDIFSNFFGGGMRGGG
ncbi:DnaJ protein erdj3a [Sarracenia purpurea var. burkii]